MRRRTVWALVLLAHATSAHGQVPASVDQATNISTHVVLRLRPMAQGAQAAQSTAANGFGLRSVERVHQRFNISRATPLAPERIDLEDTHPLSGVWIVETPPGTDLEQLLAAYASLPEVVYAEPDRLLSLFSVNDSLYSWQWPLHNSGQGHPAIVATPGSGNDTLVIASGLAGADIQADGLESEPGPEGDPPVVAIVDTGIDPNHPELAGMIWRNPGEIAGNGWDDDHNGYTDDVQGWDHSGDLFKIPPPSNGDANPTDLIGHGTHCAGLVGALSNNSRGIAGVAGAPGACQLMAIKIFPLALNSISARALAYAVDNGADVISMSWGGAWRTQVLEDAVNYALASGVVLVAAAGNGGDESPMYPAAFPGVIAVGATDHNDRLTHFSSRGPHLSVVAPGLDVLSLRASNTDMYAPVEPGVHKIGLGYYLASGTSMAAPLVAGAVARLCGLSPGLHPARARALLEQTAADLLDPLGEGDSLAGRDDLSGAGRIDLAALLAQAPDVAAQITAPSPNEAISGTVEIVGTAASESGFPYVLDYGQGAFPDSWTLLASSQAQLRGAPLGEWSTTGLDGLYTLRLRVGDDHASLVRVHVGNRRLAQITAPAEGDSVVSWVEAIGSASDPNFLAYLIELGEGVAPSSWSIVHQSTRPVVNGSLAAWHSGDRPDGWYTLRLRLISNAGEVAGDTVSFYLQSTFSTARAWKTAIGATGPALVANFGALDTDPPLEIVVGTSEGIRAFTPDGQTDVQAQSKFLRAGPCMMPLAVGDTDGDGQDDLVAVNDSGVIWVFPSTEPIRAIRAPEPPILSTLLGIEEYIQPTLFLKDIDGDNRDEIHYYGGFSAIDTRSYWVLRSDGSVPPLKLSTENVFGVYRTFMEYLPADLNGDGTDELYVALNSLCRLDHDGQLTGRVPLADSAGRAASAVSCSAVDIDNDGRLELVVMAITKGAPSRYILLAFEEDLTAVSGWPRETGIEYFWTPSEPVFCDIDGDGMREYFISWFDTELGRVSAWHSDGQPLSGHASYSVWTSSTDPAKFRSPIATDLNSDGQADLLSCATEDMYLTFPVERIIAWDQLGQLLPGWPVILESGGPLTGSARRQTTSCGDLDRNGLTDVMMVTSENNLVFINVPGATYDSAASRVEFWRYNRSLNNTEPVSELLRVESVKPTRLQADVPVNAAVSIAFNHPLLATQQYSHLFEVTGTSSGNHVGSVHYEPQVRRLTFTSDRDFVPGDTVTVRVSSDLYSDSGRSLGHNFVTSFLVGAQVPDIVDPQPVPGSMDVNRYTPLALQFTTPMDRATIVDTTLAVMGNVHGHYTGSVEYDSVARVATFIPDEPFAPAELITVTLRPGVMSTQGILRDSSFSWSFTVAWPLPEYSIPAPLSPGAPRSTYVAVHIDGPLPEFAVNDSAMWVYSETAGRRRGTVSFAPSTQFLRWMPADPFRLGERITAVAPSLRWTWTFSINSVGGAIRFTPPVTCPVSATPLLITAGDVDGDGVPELVAGQDESPYVYVVHRSQTGGLSVDSVLAGGTVSQALLADYDGDFDLDLVTVDRIGHSLARLQNLGDGRFAPPVVMAVPGLLECGVHDLNSDGHLDLYSQRLDTPELVALLGQGDGGFVETPRWPLPLKPASAIAFDADGDGRPDLITADAAGTLSQFTGDGRGSFAFEATWSAGAGVVHLASCDMDKDGDADLAVLTAAELQLWRGTGGRFVMDTVYSAGAGAARVRTADFDADGRPDLALAGGTRSSVLILKGNESGRFALALEIDFTEPVGSVAVADLDADGDLDVATGGNRSVGLSYYGGGSDVSEESSLLPGQFELAQNYPNPFNPSTEITFAVPAPAHVSLEVFNVLGRRVAVLKNEVMAAGFYSVPWEGRSETGPPLPSGVYFYRLRSADITLTRRMLFLK